MIKSLSAIPSNLISASPKFLQSVQPNPFISELHIHMELAMPQLINADIVDLNGRTIIAKTFNGERGKNHFLISDAGTLKGGFYILRLKNTNSLLFQQKLVKVEN